MAAGRRARARIPRPEMWNLASGEGEDGSGEQALNTDQLQDQLLSSSPRISLFERLSRQKNRSSRPVSTRVKRTCSPTQMSRVLFHDWATSSRFEASISPEQPHC